MPRAHVFDGCNSYTNVLPVQNLLFVIVTGLGFSGCLLSVPVHICEASWDGQQVAVGLPES